MVILQYNYGVLWKENLSDLSDQIMKILSRKHTYLNLCIPVKVI